MQEHSRSRRFGTRHARSADCSMLKIALAAQSAQADDPARVLQGLNQALCGKCQHHYVIVAYVFVDMEKRTLLLYAGAGHPPLLLWAQPCRGVRDVTENGLFLGMFDFASYSSAKVPLAPAVHRWKLRNQQSRTCGDWKGTLPPVSRSSEERFGQSVCR
jgi:Stage II sporulation protein E (SpoIIE)